MSTIFNKMVSEVFSPKENKLGNTIYRHHKTALNNHWVNVQGFSFFSRNKSNTAAET